MVLILVLAVAIQAAPAKGEQDGHDNILGADYWYAQADLPEEDRLKAMEEARLQFGKAKQKERKYLEQLRLLKLLELLDLEEDQEIQFITSFRKMRRNIRRLDNTRGELMIRLTRLVNAENVKSKRIESTIDELLELNQQKYEMQVEFVADAGEILRPAQLAKLVIFLERFERELLDHVREFQKRRQRGRQTSDN
jgi:hypothetical protein